MSAPVQWCVSPCLITFESFLLLAIETDGEPRHWSTPQLNRRPTMSGVYDFSAQLLEGEKVSFNQYKGQVLLIVNTASACAFTPQYKGLQQLHDALASRGFSVLRFPCNQFAAQEPGDARQIRDFCDSKYAVTFPMFAKIDVNGVNAHPLYNYLTREKWGPFGPSIKWNFTKFLADRSGKVVARHPPTVLPERLRREIEALL